MAKLLMITGLGSAKDLASGKKGAFYNTLEEFHKYWDRIDIVVPKVKNPVKNIFGNVFIHSSPWPLASHPLFFISKILELHRKVNFDLMTVQEFPPFYNGIGAWIVSVFSKIPYVLEVMHIPGYPKVANFKERFYKLSTKLFINLDASRAKAVRVINKKETPEFLVKAGVPRQKLIYIPASYIDLDIFKPMPMEKKYDLSFVGRLEKNKGISLFLETVKKLNVKAIIIGDGGLRAKIKFEIENYKLKIDMHGWAKDSGEISGLLNKSKVLVMPSYNEGGPRVVLEAMACGVPVVATRVGLMPDIINDGVNGLFIDWTADDIAQKTAKLLKDTELQKKFREAGFETVKQFERKAAIKNYADKLRGLI